MCTYNLLMYRLSLSRAGCLKALHLDESSIQLTVFEVHNHQPKGFLSRDLEKRRAKPKKGGSEKPLKKKPKAKGLYAGMPQLSLSPFSLSLSLSSLSSLSLASYSDTLFCSFSFFLSLLLIPCLCSHSVSLCHCSVFTVIIVTAGMIFVLWHLMDKPLLPLLKIYLLTHEEPGDNANIRGKRQAN